MQRSDGPRPAGRRLAACLLAALAIATAGAIAARAADGQGGEGGPGGESGASDSRISPAVREALALQANVESGARLYQSCAVCHGADGRGRADGTFPQLAGQHRQVLIKQLVDIREGRRANPIMAPFANALIDAQDLADVAAYIETLPVPEPAAPPEARPEQLETGRRLYERDCQGCHGSHAEGDGQRFVPRLAGQNPPYLLRQIRAIAAGRRGNAHPQMQRRISGYTDAQLQAVVAFVVRGAGHPAPSDSR